MLISIVVMVALSPIPTQAGTPSGQVTPSAVTGAAPTKRGRHIVKRVRTPKPPTTTATGTTTPRPSDPAGTVPPGAPGTKDPTLPGSPPH